MTRAARLRLVACLAATALAPLASAVGDAGAKSGAKKAEYYRGKVVPVADLAAKAGARLDADAAPHWLALVTDEGKVYPLLKDAGSRLFYKDKRLLNRPMRLLARPLPGSQVLRVLSVQSVIKGVPHEVYYWCDVCSIRRGEKMTCECCGGPMELREEPVKK
jgi:hypothetical protein